MTRPPATPAQSAIRIGTTIAILMVVWLFWSGYLKPLLVTLGLVSCLVVTLLSWRMGNLEQDMAWQRRLLRFPGYWLWLGGEVVKSNLEVARVILSPRLHLQTRIVSVDAEATDPLGQALLGNSITLTPGTLTLALEHGRLQVHCLTPDGAAALAEGAMNRRVAALTRA